MQTASTIPIATSTFGNDGCNGANQVFTAALEVVDDPAVIGPLSRLAASSSGDVLYVTGADGTVRAWDFSLDPTMPTETTVVPVGEIDTLLASVLASAPTAVLSGVAVLDPTNLVLVEHASNTILIASLVNPSPSVGFYIGFPDENSSFVDSIGGASRFNFPSATPVDIVTTGDGRLFVADAGNHAVREAELGSNIFVRTVGGLGLPSSADGPLGSTGFDTPTGLSIACDGSLLITESGPAGNRLRSLSLGGFGLFGSREGGSATLAGDGTPATAEGVAELASLAQPVSPVSTASGEVYFVDAATGILRRFDLTTGTVDCPLFADCAAAVLAGGSFSGAGNYALAITSSDNLYVLDGTAGKLFLITP